MLNGHHKTAWVFNLWGRGVEPCLLLVMWLLHMQGETAAHRCWCKARDTWWRWYRSRPERWRAPSCFFSFLRLRRSSVRSVKIKVHVLTILVSFPFQRFSQCYTVLETLRGAGLRSFLAERNFGFPVRSCFRWKVVSPVSLTAVVGREGSFRSSSNARWPACSWGFLTLCCLQLENSQDKLLQQCFTACFCAVIKTLNYRFYCTAFGANEGRDWVTLWVSSSLLSLF